MSPGPVLARRGRHLGWRSSARSAATMPILGVCLGHQCIGAAYGGRMVRAGRPMHGKTSLIHHDGTGVFAGLPDPFRATRYHSLVVAPEGLPADCVVTARSEDGEIMALRHRSHPVRGRAVPPRVGPHRARRRRCWRRSWGRSAPRGAAGRRTAGRPACPRTGRPRRPAASRPAGRSASRSSRSRSVTPPTSWLTRVTSTSPYETRRSGWCHAASARWPMVVSPSGWPSSRGSRSGGGWLPPRATSPAGRARAAR